MPDIDENNSGVLPHFINFFVGTLLCLATKRLDNHITFLLARMKRLEMATDYLWPKARSPEFVEIVSVEKMRLEHFGGGLWCPSSLLGDIQDPTVVALFQ